MRLAALATAGAALLFAAPALAAELSVGSGSALDLGTGSLDLGCADLSVAGTFSAGTQGFAAARDVTIDPSGLLNGGSATLEVTGDWDNAGSFSAGTSTVRLLDGCALASAVISGNTSFANLEMTTTTGFLYRFAAGSTQTVTGSLMLAGAAGNRLTIRSTVDGSEAFLDLQGTQSANYVDVNDNHAIGNPISLPQNSVVGSNSSGWSSLAGAVPSIGLLGLALLCASLAALGRRRLSLLR